MWRHFVYLHSRADTGEPFYVGKGSRRIRDKSESYERAYTQCRRSYRWRSIVAAHGLQVDVIACCSSDADAQRIETDMIQYIGRLDLGQGPLINLTDGGEGHAGIVVSDALRAVRSRNASGKRSDAWVKSIRVARKNGGNGGVVNKGDKLPDTWVRAIADGMRGARNPFFGKTTAIAKKVRNAATGAVYDSVAKAAEAEGVGVKALYQYLDGTRPNRTALVRLSLASQDDYR